MSDIDIEKSCVKKNISDIAKSLNLTDDDIECYGKYKAKLSYEKMQSLFDSKNKGKLILVTAITPTPAGEGKSTVSIGLADSLHKLDKKVSLALREPSLGPVFGIKGGACGGGHAQITPMIDINLNFTGDLHAITAANNLISAIIDNEIKNGVDIDPKSISWKRCMDMNDRSLRDIIIGCGNKGNGTMREDHFTITAASEMMSILCFSTNYKELKSNIGNIIIGKNKAGETIHFKQLGKGDETYVDSVALLLRDAIKPNLVQTLYGTPAFVHCGPFANIAHGCNSANATLSSMALSDYTVTEAGFAADLGAEKFLDIKCRKLGIKPNCAVIVATVRALKMHGGVSLNNISEPNEDAVKNGCNNLKVHISNLQKFGVPIVVAINKFTTDTEEEIKVIEDECKSIGIDVALCESWEKGEDGAIDLAKKVIEKSNKEYSLNYVYSIFNKVDEKISMVAKEIYHAKDVEFSDIAKKKILEISKTEEALFPVCIAKTQNSISHDPKLLNDPHDYIFPIKDIQVYAGSQMIVAYAGDIMTMPGLPKEPSALHMTMNDNGDIDGLS
jgi:formate--tetrahydrofolate ligase